MYTLSLFLLALFSLYISVFAFFRWDGSFLRNLNHAPEPAVFHDHRHADHRSDAAHALCLPSRLPGARYYDRRGRKRSAVDFVG